MQASTWWELTRERRKVLSQRFVNTAGHGHAAGNDVGVQQEGVTKGKGWSGRSSWLLGIVWPLGGATLQRWHPLGEPASA